MDIRLIGLIVVGIALVLMILQCLRMWVGDNYQRGEEERQPEPEQPSGPTLDERLDRICEIIGHLRIDIYDVRQDLRSVANDVAQNADDLEPLRRKLHEVAQKVDHVAGHFAFVPTAEILED